ncbi:MAG: murein biosynthesis integral membrane protein MurJ [Pseudomonadota bacterium]
MKPIRLMSGFLTVGFWTLASRVLGFVREVMLLSLIGPGPLMDAFVAAFRLPNMFRRFFAEGAFNAAFVPMFAGKVEAGEDAATFGRDALNGLALVTLLLTALAMIFMPALVWATAGGFDAERFDLTVGFGRVVFPYIFFMSLSALFSGVLNASGRFAAAAAAPVLLNIFVIAAMGTAWVIGAEVITWLIWVIPLAGIAQLALTWGAATRAGFALQLGLPRWTPDMGRMVRTAVPAALATGVMQINLVVGQLVASQYDSAVSWLFAADRLYQLPLGVVGIAVGIVLLPDLARRLKADDLDGARNAYSRAGEFAMALTVPSAIALIVIPLPLVSVLFGRGETGADDVAAIAVAVAIYGAGLPAFVLQKVVQPQYFARGDTRRPFHFALAAMVINAAIAIGLAPLVGWIAPALATTVAGWAMLGLLYWGLRGMGGTVQVDARYRARLPRIFAASLAMGVALWIAGIVLKPALGTDYVRYIALLALIGVGAVCYLGAAQVLGALKLSEIKGAVRRG